MLNLDGALVPYLVYALGVTISLLASCHVVLHKRDTRSAIGWIGLIWLSPFLGTILYTLLGVNRISRRAQSLRRGQPRSGADPASPLPNEQIPERLSPENVHLSALARLVGRVTQRPLYGGNAISPLADGDEAFPKMLQAIEGARRSVALSTYIFNDDHAGRMFVEALGKAVDRGVEVRVLVDEVGARYDLPTIMGPLRRAKVTVATFLPSLAPGWIPYLNLRDHRKILVVDGSHGFTGGMNIDADYLLSLNPPWPKHDLHFQVEGPVVAHLQQTFADDWVFCTGELLQGERWFPSIEPVGPVLARGIADGPEENLRKLSLVIEGAIACSRSSVRIVSPYFLPDASLISALSVAAMRGVQVEILLPRKNNLTLVQWASTALLSQVLEGGSRVWCTPPPFDHTKLMVVDSTWSLIGSANWDPRSLRLNFEFDVECYSPELAGTLERLIDEKLKSATEVTLEWLTNRNLLVRLRDGLARLLSPYL